MSPVWDVWGGRAGQSMPRSWLEKGGEIMSSTLKKVVRKANFKGMPNYS
jgi:hypothetical protein